MPGEVISIERFGGQITNPQSEDIPNEMAVWARDTDPNYKGKLKGIPVNGSAITAAAESIPDVYESDWLNYQISGTDIRDLVYIDRRTRDIRLNDIVLFPSFVFKVGNVEYFTLHRIIGVTKTHYITKGDNNTETDGLVLKEKVVGKFVRVIA